MLRRRQTDVLERPLEVRGLLLRIVEDAEQEGVFLHPHDRVQGRVLHVRGAAALEPDVRFVRQSLTEGEHDATLADAGFARERDGLAAAFGGQAPAVNQKTKFLPTSDQRSGRILPGIARSRPHGTARGRGRRRRAFAMPFSACTSERFGHEVASYQPEGGVAHDDGARGGQFLESRRQIGGCRRAPTFPGRELGPISLRTTVPV